MDEKPSYSYGKRPLWQWILLYVIIGGALYALAYYVFLAGKGYNYSPNQYQSAPTGSSAPSPNQPAGE